MRWALNPCLLRILRVLSGTDDGKKYSFWHRAAKMASVLAGLFHIAQNPLLLPERVADLRKGGCLLVARKLRKKSKDQAQWKTFQDQENRHSDEMMK